MLCSRLETETIFVKILERKAEIAVLGERMAQQKLYED